MTFIEHGYAQMKFSRRIGRFKLDRLVLGLMMIGAAGLAARGWLHDNPQHSPWAPLNVNDPVGWATATKLSALKDAPDECRAVLETSGVALEALPPVGEGACRRSDRLMLTAGGTASYGLAPVNPQLTCAAATALEIWMRQTVQPAAEEIFMMRVAKVEHLGTYNCRRIGGGEAGRWSEHATGNAIDIAAFVLEDGQRISVLGDWQDGGGESDESDEGRFLHRVRDAACQVFATVLSPDYNAAHANHLHLDQADRMIGSACR